MLTYNTTHTIAEISVADYIAGYRDTDKFIAFCKQCNRYNTCWACPPFDFDTEAYIHAYDKAYLIGTKITLTSTADSYDQGVKEIRAIMVDVRLNLDKQLLETEKSHTNSKAFFAGTCHVCPEGECTRSQGKPCIAPDKVRPSLEAFGFDMGKTSAQLLGIEMKWGAKGSLPEYLTLVSGFFTCSESVAFKL